MADNKLPMKIELGKLVTPIGPAVWPKLTQPDTKFKAEGVYETRLRYDNATGETIREKLNKFLEDAFTQFQDIYSKSDNPKAKAKAKRMTAKYIPLTADLDEDGDETGDLLLKVTRKASGVTKAGKPWKAKIKFADSKGNPVKAEGLQLWSGSEIRVFTTVFGFFAEKDCEVGITLEIQGVQIKKAVSGGGDRDVQMGALEDASDDDFQADADDMGPIDGADDNEAVDF